MLSRRRERKALDVAEHALEVLEALLPDVRDGDAADDFDDDRLYAAAFALEAATGAANTFATFTEAEPAPIPFGFPEWRAAEGAR